MQNSVLPINLRFLFHTLILVLAFILCAPPARAAPPSPDLGLVINLDGDNAFPAETLAESTAALQREIDSYADVHVKTLCYSLGAGSDILLYPTKVADTWGWRKTKYDTDPRWQSRIERMRNNMAQGGDALRTAGARAKARGMLFFPSLRMNDGHFVFGQPPEAYPLTGKFWLEHRNLVIGTSPIHARAEYGQLLDFSHAEVRDYRLREIFEAIDRYQDILDGFELDFTRFQVFFPDGKAAESAPLMTDLVTQVRQKLDAIGANQHRSLLLIARVPPSPANCSWSGLDVQTWADRGIVDVIVPSQMMTMGFEQPIDQFKSLVAKTNVKIYSSLLPRVVWSFPFDASSVAGKLESPNRELSIEQLRGAADNAYCLKANGLYLFNFSIYAHLATPINSTAPIDLSNAASFQTADTVFSISKAYWYDNEDGYEYRKQLPAPLVPGTEKSFKLLIGGDMTANASAHKWLRIGFRNPPSRGQISISLNGMQVHAGRIASTLSPSYASDDAAVAKLVASHSELPTHFALFQLGDSAPPVRGQNTIAVTIEGPSDSSAITITDIDVGLFH